MHKNTLAWWLLSEAAPGVPARCDEHRVFSSLNNLPDVSCIRRDVGGYSRDVPATRKECIDEWPRPAILRLSARVILRNGSHPPSDVVAPYCRRLCSTPLGAFGRLTKEEYGSEVYDGRSSKEEYLQRSLTSQMVFLVTLRPMPPPCLSTKRQQHNSYGYGYLIEPMMKSGGYVAASERMGIDLNDLTLKDNEYYERINPTVGLDLKKKADQDGFLTLGRCVFFVPPFCCSTV